MVSDTLRLSPGHSGQDGGKRAPNPPRTSRPKTLPDQVRAVGAVLAAQEEAIGLGDVARRFKGARKDRLAEVLSTLVALGRAREDGKGGFAAS